MLEGNWDLLVEEDNAYTKCWDVSIRILTDRKTISVFVFTTIN